MSRAHVRFSIPLALSFILGFAPPVPAQEPAAPGASNAELDRQVHELVRTVVNKGADLFNREGDQAGCARLFEGSLLTLRPLLAHHPDIQKDIDAAFAKADRTPDPRARAFIFRQVLGNVRDRLKPATAARVPVRRPPASESAAKTPRPPEPAKIELPPSTLWLRLGGETGVRKLVDDWVKLAAADSKVNFTRGGKFKPSESHLAEVKNGLVAFISQVSQGPLEYKGKDMKSAHAGMAISDAEFDALVADLRTAMATRGMKDAEIQDLVKLVDSSRKEIVEPAKPVENKPPQAPTDTKKDEKGTPKKEPEPKKDAKKEEKKEPEPKKDAKKEELKKEAAPKKDVDSDKQQKSDIKKDDKP